MFFKIVRQLSVSYVGPDGNLTSDDPGSNVFTTEESLARHYALLLSQPGTGYAKRSSYVIQEAAKKDIEVAKQAKELALRRIEHNEEIPLAKTASMVADTRFPCDDHIEDNEVASRKSYRRA